jgi:transcriptional regulator with XRE-family HTH domain
VPHYDEEIDRGRIAIRVTTARIRRGWSKEEAAKRAGISSITWKRIEDGLRVQDTKLAAVAKALQLKMAGHQPNPLLDPSFYAPIDLDDTSLKVPWTPEQIEAATALQDQRNDLGLSVNERLLRIRLSAMQRVETMMADAEDHAARVVETDPDQAQAILASNAQVVQRFLESVERMVQNLRDQEAALSEGSSSVPDAIAAHEEEVSIVGEQEESDTP